MSVHELEEIMPRPVMRPRFARPLWAEVEGVLGVGLPQDYKDFIDLYGAGKICEFISIFSPFAANINLNLINQVNRQSAVLNEIALSGEVLPYPIFPIKDGILAVGATDNGDIIYWRTGPGRWSVVLNEARGTDWEIYDLSLVEFLIGLLSGQVSCRIFPKLPLVRPIKFTPFE